MTHNVKIIQKGGAVVAWKLASQIGGKKSTGHLPTPKDCSSDSEASEKCNQFFIQKVINLRETSLANQLLKQTLSVVLVSNSMLVWPQSGEQLTNSNQKLLMAQTVYLSQYTRLPTML